MGGRFCATSGVSVHFCATGGVSVQRVAFLCNKWGVRFAQQLHRNGTAECDCKRAPRWISKSVGRIGLAKGSGKKIEIRMKIKITKRIKSKRKIKSRTGSS